MPVSRRKALWRSAEGEADSGQDAMRLSVRCILTARTIG